MRNAPNQTQAAKTFGPGRVALRRGFGDVLGCGRRRFARRRRAQFLFALAFFFLLLLLGEVALAFCECVVGFGQLTVLFRGYREDIYKYDTPADGGGSSGIMWKRRAPSSIVTHWAQRP